VTPGQNEGRSGQVAVSPFSKNIVPGVDTILLTVPVLIGALPTGPHSANRSCYPGGGLGVLPVLVLLVMGRI
jgi:hypothetical protein